ncbi:MAG TPA: hypothetical protein VE173_16485, partial [Longimicrobiales bacterium]|nr:hypothetical protein [Longimicrobiales bacterium]
PSFVLARAYLDQLERSGGLAADRVAAVRSELDRAEGMRAGERGDALSRLATRLDDDARDADDGAKVDLLRGVVRELAAM